VKYHGDGAGWWAERTLALFKPNRADARAVGRTGTRAPVAANIAPRRDLAAPEGGVVAESISRTGPVNLVAIVTTTT
jgi:hypothetical protein